MVICKLMGGLGNQLFQYAYASELALKTGDKLCLDTTFYGEKIPAIFKFNIDNTEIMNPEKLSDFKAAETAGKIYHLVQKPIRMLRHERIGEGLFEFCAARGYYYNYDPFFYESPITTRANKYVYGYFQGEEYFASVAKSVREQFVLKPELGSKAKEYLKDIREHNSIAVHIRMGDYTQRKNQYMNVCTDRYYESAIRYMKQRFPDAAFYVFTNDVERVKQKPYLSGSVTFVEGLSDVEDFSLMQACSNFVISGSTFSWWGSYLSDNERKVTAAPGIWMKTLREEPAIYRKDMIKFDC